MVLFREVTANAFFEIFGFAHVDNHLLRIEVFVYAGFVGERLQYIGEMCRLHTTKLRLFGVQIG
jgi:hypothetical protein